MSNLLTDVTPVLMQAFPNGKPEMSASDFDRALQFVNGRKNGAVPKPGKYTMDYARWAHAMVVGWRMLVADWEAAGKSGPEPHFLLCPECECMMLLDMSSGDVLQCPGGCHRAIRVNTFVDLFKKPPPPRTSGLGYSPVPMNTYKPPVPMNTYKPIGQAKPGPASLDRTVPKGHRPEDYGITEGVQKSKKALVGWRMWDVRPDTPGILRSLHQGARDGWPAMEPLRGLCAGKTVDEIHDHSCPSWEHRCGVHAVKDLPQTSKWGKAGSNNAGVRMLGEIEMWGRVLEYQEGFRAEWAYPLKLYLPSKIPDAFGLTPEQLGDKLWERYLVEVVVDDEIYKIP